METPPASAFTVGIIYVKPLELMAIVSMLDHKFPSIAAVDDLPYVYTLGRIGEHNVAIAGLARGHQGTVATAHLAATLRSTFRNMTMGMLVGIGGGIPRLPEHDVRLGDVVVGAPESGPHVVQYDFGKRTADGFETSRVLAHPPPLLLHVVNHVELSLMLRADNEEQVLARHLSRISGSRLLRREYRKPATPDRLFDAAYQHEAGTLCLNHDEVHEIRREPRSDDEDIVVHYSTILSGDSVMKSAKARDTLSTQYNGALCIEMEAAGAMDVFPCLVIRGISDYADSHKSSEWQKYAALAAAAYMRELLLRLPGKTQTPTLLPDRTELVRGELTSQSWATNRGHVQPASLPTISQPGYASSQVVYSQSGSSRHLALVTQKSGGALERQDPSWRTWPGLTLQGVQILAADLFHEPGQDLEQILPTDAFLNTCFDIVNISFHASSRPSADDTQGLHVYARALRSSTRPLTHVSASVLVA